LLYKTLGNVTYEVVISINIFTVAVRETVGIVNRWQVVNYHAAVVLSINITQRCGGGCVAPTRIIVFTQYQRPWQFGQIYRTSRKATL